MSTVFCLDIGSRETTDENLEYGRRALQCLDLAFDKITVFDVGHAVFYGKGREGHHDIQALRAHARQAKNKQLEIDASEIRFRAERPVGEMIAEQREARDLRRALRETLAAAGQKLCGTLTDPHKLSTTPALLLARDRRQGR